MKDIIYKGSADTLKTLKNEFPYYNFINKGKSKGDVIIEELSNGEIVFKGNREKIIDFLNKRENYIQDIMDKDITFLISAEIARGIGHYYFNIITSILLQIDLINMENIENQRIKDGIKRIEEKINQIVKAIERLRILKIGEFEYYKSKEFLDEITVLLSDYLITQKTKLELITNIKTLNRDNFNKIIILYLEIVLFLFHLSEKKESKIKVYIYSDKDNINLTFEYESKKDINIMKNNSIDINMLNDSFQKIYYISIIKNLKKLNAEMDVFVEKNKLELIIDIKGDNNEG